MHILWNAVEFSSGKRDYHGMGTIRITERGYGDVHFYGDYWRSFIKTPTEYGWNTISH